MLLSIRYQLSCSWEVDIPSRFSHTIDAFTDLFVAAAITMKICYPNNRESFAHIQYNRTDRHTMGNLDLPIWQSRFLDETPVHPVEGGNPRQVPGVWLVESKTY